MLEYSFVIIEVPSGAPTGSGMVQFIEFNQLANNSRVWTDTLFLNMFAAEGDAVIGTSIQVTPTCDDGVTGTCQISNTPPNSAELVLDEPLKDTWTYTSNSTATVFNSTQTDFVISNTKAFGQARGQTPDMYEIRCDNDPAFAKLTPNGGCAFDNFYPTYQLSLSDSKVQQTAAHIYATQHNEADHWGLYPNGTVLTRLVNSFAIAANRRAACSSFVGTKLNDSCDEFPFASTYQGAAIVGAGRYTTAHVDLTDNKTAGARLGAMYRTNRMLDADPFWVNITP